MQYLTLAAALLAGNAMANPVPQGLDWDAIEDPSLPKILTADIPIVSAVASQTVVPFEPTEVAAASVVAAVQADPTDTSMKLRKRVDNSACGANTPSDDDTAEAFLASSTYPAAATNAVTPDGYSVAYTNQQASSQGVYGYMGYSILQTYDTQLCATRCNNIEGCVSINTYFERDGSTTPKSGCTNPSSTPVIKCVYYGGPVTPSSATNSGQWQDDFHVVIAGSNGYVSTSIAVPSGYSNLTPLGNSAIDAPLDCSGADTYMGVKIFTSGPFSASLCAAACTATSDYNRAVPINGYSQTCQFFNTYVLYNGTEAVGQYCAMYNETWPASFATNNGQYRGPYRFNIGYSYAFSNTTAGADQTTECQNPSAPK